MFIGRANGRLTERADPPVFMTSILMFDKLTVFERNP
jgi:hypothetical protein